MRYELTDCEWAAIKPFLPNKPRGVPRVNDRRVLNGTFWVLRSGAPWRDLPERYGKFGTVNARFNRWRREGLFDKILKALQIRLDKQGKIDWDLWLVDGTNIRASRAAAGAHKKSTRSTSSNPMTTTWAAAVADGAQSSTWLLTARALSSEQPSPRAKRTNRPNSTT